MRVTRASSGRTTTTGASARRARPTGSPRWLPPMRTSRVEAPTSSRLMTTSTSCSAMAMEGSPGWCSPSTTVAIAGTGRGCPPSGAKSASPPWQGGVEVISPGRPINGPARMGAPSSGRLPAAMWSTPLTYSCLRSGQVHFPEQRLEPWVPAQGNKEERTFDTEHPAGSLLVSALEPIHRSVVLSEARVDIRHVIRRDVSLTRSFLELSQHLPGLVGPAHQREGLAELCQVQGALGR